MQHTFLKIDAIAGIHYSCGKPTDTIVVYGRGAPTVPDDGTLPEAVAAVRHGVDMFVPDYIGYGRSDGICTPENCTKTFLELYNSLKSGCVGRNSYQQTTQKLKYTRIIFVGRSFGGAYVPLLPRYNAEIAELGLIFPVVDSKSCGSIASEETNEQFLRSMREDGYCYLYRGILSKEWEDHLENKDDLSPMDNIEYLRDARLFIGHGKKDAVVHYTKSARYHYAIVDALSPEQDHLVLKLYQDGGHDTETACEMMDDCLVWLDV